MNLEQLQAMSDAELNELSAVKVMGWETSLSWGGTDWIQGFVSMREKIRWNPTTDMNDAMELLKHIPDYRVELVFEKELSFTCSVFEDDIVCLFSVDSENPARAITIASILAKE